jgi:hypothetical protein
LIPGRQAKTENSSHRKPTTDLASGMVGSSKPTSTPVGKRDMAVPSLHANRVAIIYPRLRARDSA